MIVKSNQCLDLILLLLHLSVLFVILYFYHSIIAIITLPWEDSDFVITSMIHYKSYKCINGLVITKVCNEIDLMMNNHNNKYWIDTSKHRIAHHILDLKSFYPFFMYHFWLFPFGIWIIIILLMSYFYGFYFPMKIFNT